MAGSSMRSFFPQAVFWCTTRSWSFPRSPADILASGQIGPAGTLRSQIAGPLPQARLQVRRADWPVQRAHPREGGCLAVSSWRHRPAAVCSGVWSLPSLTCGAFWWPAASSLIGCFYEHPSVCLFARGVPLLGEETHDAYQALSANSELRNLGKRPGDPCGHLQRRPCVRFESWSWP